MPARPDHPPPLPSQILERVIRLGGLDGRMVLWLAGFFAVLFAASHDAVGAAAGVLAAGAGAMELHGVSLLRNADPGGVRWLVRSQALLLVAVLAYAAARIWQMDLEILAGRITPDLDKRLEELAWSREQFAALALRVYQWGYGALALGSLIYQGLMMRFYARSRAAIEQALSGFV